MKSNLKMKKLNKFNQYLLEKYPIIWNTKVIWMLLLAFSIHVIFFFIGYFSHSNPKSLYIEHASTDYFDGGLILMNVIISVIALIGWLYFMFQNNAFKNFYPNSKSKLFLQFLFYFVIIFANASFFFSYSVGLKLFINNKYDDVSVNKKIDIINKATAFLPTSLEDYTLNNRYFPKIFTEIYCETNSNKIDYNKIYYNKFLDRYYQYYTVKSKTEFLKISDGESYFPNGFREKDLIITKKNDKVETYYFKDNVFNPKPIKIYEYPNYYNYSSVFYFNLINKKIYFLNRNYYPFYDDEVDFKINENFQKERYLIAENTAKILDNKDRQQLLELLSDFLKISKEFKIENNLDANSWTNSIFESKDFEVENYFRNIKPTAKDKSVYDYGYEYKGNDIKENYFQQGVRVQSGANTYDNETQTQNDGDYFTKNYFENQLTDTYYNTHDLRNSLLNIDTIKKTDYFTEPFPIVLWLSFIIATLVFAFRVTSLRALLYTTIFSGVVLVVLGLLFVIIRSIKVEEDYDNTLITFYLLFIFGSIILVCIFFIKKINKNIFSILINITMIGFGGYLWLIAFIYSLHQKNYFKVNEIYDRDSLIEGYLIEIAYVLLILSFVFIYFYSGLIQKWKSLPSKN